MRKRKFLIRIKKNPLKNFMHINYRFICETISFLIFHPTFIIYFIYLFNPQKKNIKSSFYSFNNRANRIFSHGIESLVSNKTPLGVQSKTRITVRFPLKYTKHIYFQPSVIYRCFFFFLLSAKEGWLNIL